MSPNTAKPINVALNDHNAPNDLNVLNEPNDPNAQKLTDLQMDVGAADKAAIQLVRLRLSSAEVKSSRISCSCRIRSDTTSWGK